MKRQTYSPPKTNRIVQSKEPTHAPLSLPKPPVPRAPHRNLPTTKRQSEPEKLTAHARNAHTIDANKPAVMTSLSTEDASKKAQEILQKFESLHIPTPEEGASPEQIEEDIKTILSPHIKFKGLVVPVSCDAVGDLLIQNGLFLRKICQWIKHNPYVNEKLLINRIVDQFRDKIVSYKGAFESYIKLIMPENKTEIRGPEPEEYQKMPEKKQSPPKQRPLSFAERVKMKASAHTEVAAKVQPTQDRPGSVKITAPPHKVPEHLLKQRFEPSAQGLDKTVISQKMSIQNPLSYQQYILNKKTGQSNTKQTGKSKETIQLLYPSLSQLQAKINPQDKKKRLMNDNDRYSIDFFEINDVYLLQEVDIVGILNPDYRDLGLFAVLLIKKKEENSAEQSAVAPLKGLHHAKMDRQMDSTLKDLEREHTNLEAYVLRQDDQMLQSFHTLSLS